VPVFSKGHFDKNISDIEINNNEDWAKRHYKAIALSYARAPYWKQYKNFFEDLYLDRSWNKLVDLNEYMLKWFLVELGLNVEFYSMTDFSFEGKKSDLVLDMCKKMNADKYIFGELGKGYADVVAFTASGVEPFFQEYIHPNYKQLHGDFVSHMAIIDLLFMYGGDSFEVLMSGNLKDLLS
jgi:hypothetical protein